MLEALLPKRKSYILFSSHFHSNELLLQELASREWSNRMGLMTVGDTVTNSLKNVNFMHFPDHNFYNTPTIEWDRNIRLY